MGQGANKQVALGAGSTVWIKCDFLIKLYAFSPYSREGADEIVDEEERRQQQLLTATTTSDCTQLQRPQPRPPWPASRCSFSRCNLQFRALKDYKEEENGDDDDEDNDDDEEEGQTKFQQVCGDTDLLLIYSAPQL